MAGLFEQPRNAGTLCMDLRLPTIRRHAHTAQFSAARKSVEPIFEIKMVDSCLMAPFVYSIADKAPVVATQAISNVVKSSFGPSGLDKMMVDDIGVR